MFNSVDRLLWERNRQDIAQRFENAHAIIQNPNSGDGIKANAFYVLFEYYQYGYGGVTENRALASKCLRKAAQLGHAQACYEFVRRYGQMEPQNCKLYIETTLKNINDSTFDSVVHKQKSMESEINALNSIYNPPMPVSNSPILTNFNQQRNTKITLDDNALFDLLHPGLRDHLRQAWTSNYNYKQ